MALPAAYSVNFKPTTHAVTESATTRVPPMPIFMPVFSGWRKAANWLGIGVWVATLAFFWAWWFQSGHVYTVPRFALVTVVLAWVTLIPAYFIFIFASAKVPAKISALPINWRVATVVTKAPSEPLSVVKETLLGALSQSTIPHDTWLADEDPSDESLEWCGAHGIKVSSRKGVAEYQNDSWPRRKHCKEGNLAYFYDHFGYRLYDFVSQFDADHVPASDYLEHAIAPFADPAVGYVSAPSICDTNAAANWSARGRLYVEASLHGALQAGYNSGWAPLCIGSHYTVRTAALQSVGGLGPELAEDHSTTLLLNAGGWRGVHAVDAIAHGEGPETFTDLVVQEFQWSRSLIAILFMYSPAYVPRLPGRLRFQFLFSQLWYPMFSAMMAVMFVTPVYALTSGSQLVNVTYVDFFTHIFPLSATLLVLAYWWRGTGLFRPADAKILSWEGVAFLFLRWPWSLFGSLAAVVDRLRGKVADFRVTPKGRKNTEPIPLRVLAPYLILALVAGATAWLVQDPGTAAGFYLFNLINAIVYGGLTLLILLRHALENRVWPFPANITGLVSGASLLAIAATVAAGVVENGAKGLAAMNEGITAFTLTREVYSYSGAGQGGPTKPIIRFDPRWNLDK
jgi:cellulose synthase/poly-beta-1,6-N-acetylglucosamine synthase-like glycosyltransferase